jgi:hypothetical protein
MSDSPEAQVRGGGGGGAGYALGGPGARYQGPGGRNISPSGYPYRGPGEYRPAEPAVVAPMTPRWAPRRPKSKGPEMVLEEHPLQVTLYIEAVRLHAAGNPN